ncbi:MAG: hypothetical protein WC723_00785 [Candidatus Omnitrophota bacterium]
MQKIKIIVLAVILLFGFCLVRDFLIKSLVGTIATSVTGAPTNVGGLSLSIIRQSVKISNLKMYNPKGFPKDVLVDIPRMGATCNIGAFITGKIHLRQLNLEIKEIGLVKNKEGKLNVDSLKISAEKSGGKEKKPAKELSMRIDIVTLGMGRVVSKDYSVEGQPVVKVYDINLKKSYKNITSAHQLTALIISEPLKAAGVRGLKMYGVSMLTGVAALPVAAALTFGGKDYAQASFKVTPDRAYDAGLEVLKQMGTVRNEDKAGGTINAEVNGAKVTFKLKKINDTTTEITVSARKYMFPEPEIAGGVLYQVLDKLQ